MTKTKSKADKRIPFTCKILQSIKKSTKVKAGTDDIDIADLVEAGLLMVSDKKPNEVLQLIATYKEGA